MELASPTRALQKDNQMLIHNRVSRSTANGPGDRSVVWFQGCSLACAECWNKDTHKFDIKKDESILALAQWILDQDAEGVTFSGGEPFQQAPGLLVLIDILKDAKPNFSIGSFTGYTLKELQEGKYQWWSTAYNQWVAGDTKMSKEILSKMDFIIAGRYNALKRVDDKPLCGSSNQEVHFLTTRYKLSDLTGNIVEMTIDSDSGLIQITGFPDQPNRVGDDNDDDSRLVAA